MFACLFLLPYKNKRRSLLIVWPASLLLLSTVLQLGLHKFDPTSYPRAADYLSAFGTLVVIKNASWFDLLVGFGNFERLTQYGNLKHADFGIMVSVLQLGFLCQLLFSFG